MSITPGFLFAERYIDKLILTSTWLDGIHGAGCFTGAFYELFLFMVIVLVTWNTIEDEDEQLYWE